MYDTDLNSAYLGYGVQMMGAGMDLAMQYQSQKWKESEAKKVREWNQEMYEKQLADQRENWRLANEYNLPSAALARLRDAGLNPLMAYEGGQALVAAQPAQGADVNSAPAASGSMQTNFGQALAGAALVKAQIDNINADTSLKKAEAGESSSRKENFDFDVAFKKDARDLNLSLLSSQYDLNKSMESLNRENRILISRESEKTLEQIKDIQNQIKNRTDMTEAEIKNLMTRLDMDLKSLPHILDNMDSQTRLNYANAWATKVATAIQKKLFSDDYIKIMQGSAAQDLLNAIKYGRGQDIENAIKAWQYEFQPKSGSGLFEFSKFMKFGIEPGFQILKDAAIGGAALYYGRGLGTKAVGKIGFIK